jgi:hypothetical protein
MSVAPLALTLAVVTLLLTMGAAARAPSTAVTVQPVNWSANPLKIASTASTVEVDVMPFLSRSPEGGCGHHAHSAAHVAALTNCALLLENHVAD